MHSMPFELAWSSVGIVRYGDAANGGDFNGIACVVLSLAACLRSASFILGLVGDLTVEPKARAQCGNSARWDLCGGRLESSRTKSRPYRDQRMYRRAT